MKCLVSWVTYEPVNEGSRSKNNVGTFIVAGFHTVCATLTEVAANDAVPCWVVLLVELLLDESSDILLDVVLLQSLHRERICLAEVDGTFSSST